MKEFSICLSNLSDPPLTYSGTCLALMQYQENEAKVALFRDTGVQNRTKQESDCKRI